MAILRKAGFVVLGALVVVLPSAVFSPDLLYYTWGAMVDLARRCGL